jgi:TrmH RNA methyltransferase
MRNKLTKELAVCGLNAAAALGEIHPEKIKRLFLREDRLKQFSRVCRDLAERKRPYKLCGDEELERLCKSIRHQGVVAMIEEPEVAEPSRDDLDLWAAEGKVGLILHSVGNDHNLGALVRSAAFFDAHFVIISEADEEARLTTSAYRVAEGGMEHVNFRKVTDTASFLKRLSSSVITVGAAPRARLRIRDLDAVIREKAAAQSRSRPDPTPRPDPTRPGPMRPGPMRPGIAVVVGNEETGLPREVEDRCAALVRIPGTGKLESLNVAQAATLFLHELYER